MNTTPRIHYYTEERIENPYPLGELPWHVYHTVRNAIVRCCTEYGSVGPMDERPILDDEEESDSKWQVGADDEEFFVLDDQMNDEQYIYVELTQPDVLTEAWIQAVMKTLIDFPGWGVGLGFRAGYILIFADELLVTGECFKECQDLAALVVAGRPVV